MKPRRIGLIDIGTNTLRLVVGERGTTKVPRFLYQEVIATRLGEQLHETGRLSQTAMERTCLGLKTLQAKAREHNAELLEAYATAWARAAANTDEMLSRAAELNLTTWVLTSREEALMAVEAAKTMAISHPAENQQPST